MSTDQALADAVESGLQAIAKAIDTTEMNPNLSQKQFVQMATLDLIKSNMASNNILGLSSEGMDATVERAVKVAQSIWDKTRNVSNL